MKKNEKIEKTVKFRKNNVIKYYNCELEEIKIENEINYINSDVEIVQWVYGWNTFIYCGKLTAITKNIDRKKDHLWLFKKDDEKVSNIHSMYYDDNQPTTRSKLYKLKEIKKEIKK